MRGNPQKELGSNQAFILNIFGNVANLLKSMAGNSELEPDSIEEAVTDYIKNNPADAKKGEKIGEGIDFQQKNMKPREDALEIIGEEKKKKDKPSDVKIAISYEAMNKTQENVMPKIQEDDEERDEPQK